MTQRPVFEELYDWFYCSYRNAPKKTLLELMRDNVDIERLRQLSQRELAEFYCQVFSVLGTWSRSHALMFFNVNANHSIM
jgi:hypothetical protein